MIRRLFFGFNEDCVVTTRFSRFWMLNWVFIYLYIRTTQNKKSSLKILLNVWGNFATEQMLLFWYFYIKILFNIFLFITNFCYNVGDSVEVDSRLFIYFLTVHLDWKPCFLCCVCSSVFWMLHYFEIEDQKYLLSVLYPSFYINSNVVEFRCC